MAIRRPTTNKFNTISFSIITHCLNVEFGNKKLIFINYEFKSYNHQFYLDTASRVLRKSLLHLFNLLIDIASQLSILSIDWFALLKGFHHFYNKSNFTLIGLLELFASLVTLSQLLLTGLIIIQNGRTFLLNLFKISCRQVNLRLEFTLFNLYWSVDELCSE